MQSTVEGKHRSEQGAGGVDGMYGMSDAAQTMSPPTPAFDPEVEYERRKNQIETKFNVRDLERQAGLAGRDRLQSRKKLGVKHAEESRSTAGDYANRGMAWGTTGGVFGEAFRRLGEVQGIESMESEQKYSDLLDELHLKRQREEEMSRLADTEYWRIAAGRGAQR